MSTLQKRVFQPRMVGVTRQVFVARMKSGADYLQPNPSSASQRFDAFSSLFFNLLKSNDYFLGTGIAISPVTDCLMTACCTRENHEAIRRIALAR